MQHFYRALAILHECWEELEELLVIHFEAVLTDEERSRQLIDTTSMYFEAEMTDREIALLNEKWDDFEAGGTLRGYSGENGHRFRGKRSVPRSGATLG